MVQYSCQSQSSELKVTAHLKEEGGGRHNSLTMMNLADVTKTGAFSCYIQKVVGWNCVHMKGRKVSVGKNALKMF